MLNLRNILAVSLIALLGASVTADAKSRWPGPAYAEPPDYDVGMFDCFPNPAKGTGFWTSRNTSSSLGSENLNHKLFAKGAACAYALSYLYIERFVLISSNPYVLQRRLTDKDKQEF